MLKAERREREDQRGRKARMSQEDVAYSALVSREAEKWVRIGKRMMN